MGIRLRPLPRFQFLTDAGAPANGYKVYCYQPGTSTLKDTYTTYTGAVANANPVILDSRGEADIWFKGKYKIKITDASDVEVYTVDNYGEGEDSVLTGNYNKVKNGGFETDTAGDNLPDDWTVTEYDASSTVLVDTTDQIEGANSLKFTSTGLGGGYADSDYFEVQEGKLETVSFALKSSAVDVRNVVDLLWYTSAKTLISTTNIYDDSATNPTSWTNKTGSATPPANARFAKIRVIGCHSSDATAGSTWFDDVAVIAGATTDRTGAIELATQAEVDARTDTERALTPATFDGAKASQADINAGSDNKKYATALALASSSLLRPYSAVTDENRVADVSSCFNQNATTGSVYINEASSRLEIKIDLYHPYNDQSVGFTRAAGASLTLYEGVYTVLLPAGMVLEHYLNDAWYIDAVFDGSAQKAGTFTAIVDSPHYSRLRNTTAATVTYYMMMAQLYG